MRTPSNMLVVSLALSDFIMMGVLVPPVVVNMFISRWWVFGEPFCNFYGFMGGVFGTSSLIIIILIGYDRYNVIVKGLSGNKITPGVAAAMILFAFGYSFGVCLPAYFKVWGRFTVGNFD